MSVFKKKTVSRIKMCFDIKEYYVMLLPSEEIYYWQNVSNSRSFLCESTNIN